jgi:hypothetical protein
LIEEPAEEEEPQEVILLVQEYIMPPAAEVIDAFFYFSLRESSMKNNAFPMDDCFTCLSKFPDAYYCSTADQ